MTAAPVPTEEKGYVIPPGNWNAWWPDLDVVEQIPELRWPENLAVFSRMQLDPQVTSVLSAVALPIRSVTWWVEPNGARPEVVAQVAEDLGLPVRGTDTAPPLRTRDRFSFVEHQDLALESLTYGHSVFEQLARIEQGRTRLRKLGWRPQHTIEKWNVARDGGLESITQHGLDQPIPVSRLVVYSHRRRGGGWQGRSVLTAAYKFWLLKDRMLRVQAMSVDRTGLGVPTYTGAPANELWTKEEQDTFAEAERLAGLAIAKQYRSGEEAGASIPHGSKLEVVGVTGNLPDPDKVIRYYDEQIARCVLANFLSLGGENSRGSYALGTTFADFFVQSLQATAKWLCDVMTQHIVEDLVDWAWGPEERAPRIVCDDIGSKHPVTADAIAALVNCGAIQPDPELEYKMRSTYGVPQRDLAWQKGDLDNMQSRVDAFKTLRDAGTSFDTAKALVGLPNLQEDTHAQR